MRLPGQEEKRKKDRHKSKADRHKDKKDRHKDKKDRHKNREAKAWTGDFIAVDGEGWDGKYTVLAMSGYAPIVNLNGLSTLDCLCYLTGQSTKANSAFVGFGLSYDFENILRDVPDEDYIKLLEEYTDAKGNTKRRTIEYEGFSLMYIPRKMLEIKVATGWIRDDGTEYIKTVLLQDVWGFFQSSFIAALEKWEIEVPPEIIAGKENRQLFAAENLKEIVEYNQLELEKLVELMNRLRQADADACTLVGLKVGHTPRTWFGPGARATNFLNQTKFAPEHPPFAGKTFEKLQAMAFPPNESEEVKLQPFAAAYYGGRIEAAAKGEFTEQMFDYDINSAYPYAFSLLPSWEPDALIEVEGLDEKERMGMYLIKWQIKEKVNFYPFPFRSESGNVFYPPSGLGWYMSPEVHQAVKLYGKQVKFLKGFVLEGTDGAGNARTRLPEEKLCTSAKMMLKIAEHRLQAKKEKLPAEKALKLVMNSCYGKTIQQVGSGKFLNFFAAAWITSVCRSMLMEAVGKDKDNSTISIMTDGILTRKKLNVPLGKNLGEWEELEIKKALQFLPGIYWFETVSGEILKRYRGMSKDFSPFEALSCLYSGKSWPITVRVFVARSLALHMKYKFEGLRYQWVEMEKEENFNLGSKRENGVIPAGRSFHFYPAKRGDMMDLITGSCSYKIKQKPAEKNYEESTSIEELLGDNCFNSVLVQEEL